MPRCVRRGRALDDKGRRPEWSESKSNGREANYLLAGGCTKLGDGIRKGFNPYKNRLPQEPSQKTFENLRHLLGGRR